MTRLTVEETAIITARAYAEASIITSTSKRAYTQEYFTISLFRNCFDGVSLPYNVKQRVHCFVGMVRKFFLKLGSSELMP